MSRHGSSPAALSGSANPSTFVDRPITAGEAARVRVGLEAALDNWWQRAQLPPSLLLRDGLLTLEAGHELDEAQVSLLLRAALAQHQGMLTALKHQTDPERTAVILADALLANPPATLTLAELDHLRRQDGRSAAWLGALPAALREESGSADAGRRQRAAELLDELHSSWPISLTPQAQWAEGDDWLWSSEAGESLSSNAPSRVRLSWIKAVLFLVPLLALALVALWWQQHARLEGMLVAPAGAYAVSPESSGGAETVDLAAFAIDRTEVTVGAYRQCINSGRCSLPSATAGVTRPNYLLDPAFAGFPMVNVDWRSAGEYCTWMGKRLPTAVEWEVAAGFAPDTQRQYVYPWGDRFQVQRANSALSRIGDTQVVGSYQPIGDSPLGVSDMAGNVAEWTATNVGRAEGGDGEGGDRFLVKGGSFRDPAAGLTIRSSQPMVATDSRPWLGFRCAMNVSDNLAPARASGVE